jgi:hypothetical protein
MFLTLLLIALLFKLYTHYVYRLVTFYILHLTFYILRFTLYPLPLPKQKPHNIIMPDVLLQPARQLA